MESFEKRFWTKVEKTEQCWLWVGATDSHGYGRARIDQGGSTGAHRVAYELLRGEIPSGLVVRHVVCRNRLCVNPAHLEVGTVQDNTDDRTNDGSTACGEAHGHARLTAPQVRLIRSLCASGRLSPVEVGELVGVHRTAIHKILHRSNWKHLD